MADSVWRGWSFLFGNPSRPKPILVLDFDGVIHGYESGWKGVQNCPDNPVPGAGTYLLRAVQHFRVAISSSRSKSIRGRLAMKSYVRNVMWDACSADPALASKSWSYITGKPESWQPWTLYDFRDQADEIIKGGISFPWFKPAALMTIDDRAVTFNGDWSDLAYSPDAIKKFKPWNKRGNTP